jgi:hypothetical protein
MAQSTASVNRVSLDAMPSAMRFVSTLETLFQHTNSYRVTLGYTAYTRMHTVKFLSFEGSTIASLEVPYNLPDDFVVQTLIQTGQKHRFTLEEPSHDANIQMRYVPLFS